MFKKIVLLIGILGALVAAEGLNRFGGLVSAFGGADAPIYMGMLIISVISAGVLLMSIFNTSNSIVKWLTFVPFLLHILLPIVIERFSNFLASNEKVHKHNCT